MNTCPDMENQTRRITLSDVQTCGGTTDGGRLRRRRSLQPGTRIFLQQVAMSWAG